MNLYFTQIEKPTTQMLAACRDKGYTPHHLPFREVHYRSDVQPRFGDYDVVIITSAHAARWLRSAARPQMDVAVVGETTLSLLDTNLNVCPPPPNVAELALQLKELFPPQKHMHFLFLRGQNARDTLKLTFGDQLDALLSKAIKPRQQQ